MFSSIDLFHRYAFDWDAVMASFMLAQSQATSLGTAYIELQCFKENPGNPFLMDSIFYLCVPPVMVVSVLLGLWVHRLHKYRSKVPKRDLCQIAWKKARSFGGAVGAMILFLLQPTLVERCALVFSCTTKPHPNDPGTVYPQKRLASKGFFVISLLHVFFTWMYMFCPGTQLGNSVDDLYLSENLSLRCWEAEHMTMVIWVGVPLFLLYVVGLPLGNLPYNVMICYLVCS